MVEEKTLSRIEMKARTRQSLAEAARELVTARGYSATTIEDIAEAAGVAPRTFFRHFATKEAALFERATTMTAILQQLLDDRPADEPVLESIRAATSVVASKLGDDPSWLLHMGRLAEEVEAVRQHLTVHTSYAMREVVVAWAERKLGVPRILDPRPGLIAGVTAAAIDTARDRWMAHSGSLSLADLVEESLDALPELFA